MTTVTGQDVWQSHYEWKEESQREAARRRDSYLLGYPDITFIDDEFVVLSADDYFRMDDYSTSVPTGVYYQKLWRRDAEPFGGEVGRFVGMYRDYDPPRHDSCELKWFKVVIWGVSECSGCQGGGWIRPGPKWVECPLCEARGQLPLDDRFPKKRRP